jgi:copper(I)-binding protein
LPILISILISILLSGCSDPPLVAATDAITISKAWAREAPPGSKNGALYVTIENKSEAPRKLVGLASASAAKAEVHNHISENNIMKMVHVPELSLPGSTTLQFKPGGLHVMLRVDLSLSGRRLTLSDFDD